ncbi:MAG: HAMP domain-containing protein [Acidimicrobiales bacterium]|nr:HAMP domain-containing protein [Acidimicrobiales bacterium]
MRRIPIRVKLAVALSVPLVAVGLVTLIEVISVANEANDVHEQAELATAAIGPKGLITALQDERNFAAANLVGVDSDLPMAVNGYPESRGMVDTRLAEFEAELDSLPADAQAAYAPALEGLDALAEVRADIDVEAAKPDLSLDNIGLTTQYFDKYTALIEPFFGGMSRISIAMDDPELRQGAELMEVVTRQLETIPQLANHLIMPANLPTGPDDTAGPGINSPAEIAKLADSHDTFRRQAEALRTAAGPYADLAAEWFPEEFTEAIDAAVDQAINTSRINSEATIATFGASQENEAELPYLGYRDAVGERIEQRADEITDAAAARQLRFGLLMAVTFAAAVALTVLVSLSITRPLRSLTRQAKEMAERRLPGAVTDILEIPLGEDVVVPQVAPVRVGTRDEVADVADALNKVQDSALDLALEQAVLRRNIADSFVNLGRRNQNLLGRQLDFITELESRETDPDTLSSLFRLDHLATRMRRNAESLLVLAGIEPPRQWAAPVRINDVVRAALGEVESYERVTVRGVAPATVQGSVAADLAHLMAELIENALVFSPPDQTVDIRGAAQRSSEGTGYTLAIMDAGLGMPPADIEAANRRLAGAESFTVAPSKYLGHYVAGNLAARHDIRVHLENSPGNGVTATVDLPATLLTTDTALPHADEPHAAREVWPPAPSGNEIPPAPLPARQPTAPAPLPQASGDGRYAQLPQPDANRPVAFPRADFGDTGRVPVYRDDTAGAWPAPTSGAEAPWSSAPVPTADAGPAPLGGGLARRQPANDAQAESRRTPSGLVKRSPRVVDTGEIQAVGLSADPDLLTSLSRFANPGQHVTGTAPVTQDRQGPAPQAPLPPSAGASPQPSRRQPPSGPAPAAPQPLRDEPFSAPRPATGTGFAGLAAGLSGVSPFQGVAPGSRDGRPDAAQVAGPDASGGLPRRVRGAQLPTPKPVQLRRSSGPADPGPAPAPSAPGGSPFGATPPPASFASPPPAPAAPADTPGKQSADAVYSFLSSFTAGVQRGLDDTRPNGQPPA